jgi:hypothetical protein
MNRKDKLKSLNANKAAKGMMIITDGEPFVEAIGSKIQELKEALGVGVDFNNLDELIESMESIKALHDPVTELKQAISNIEIPAMPKSVKIDGLDSLVKATQQLAKKKDIQKVDITSLTPITEQVSNLINAIEAIQVPKQGQEPGEYVPMRRVVLMGNKLMYDDSFYTGGGGGGSSSSSTTNSPISDADATGTIVANGDTVTVTAMNGMSGWTMGYYGTYSTGASLTMEASFDGGATYSAVRMLQGSFGTLGYVITIAAVSNSTSFFVADIPNGATHLRVRCSAWAAPTGAINIVLTQSAQRFATPNGAISITAGTITTLTTLTNITNWGNIVDNAAFTDGTTRLSPNGYIFDEIAGTALTENDAAAARIDSKRAQIGVIEDETTRGQRASVTALKALKVENGEYPTATALNTYSIRISTNTTTTPTASLCYVSSITIAVETAGTTSTVDIRDKSGTPIYLVRTYSTGALQTNGDIVYNFQTPVKMTGGIDVITAGAGAATIGVFINYYQ